VPEYDYCTCRYSKDIGIHIHIQATVSKLSEDDSDSIKRPGVVYEEQFVKARVAELAAFEECKSRKRLESSQILINACLENLLFR
jgi:hypothetical protein